MLIFSGFVFTFKNVAERNNSMSYNYRCEFLAIPNYIIRVLGYTTGRDGPTELYQRVSPSFVVLWFIGKISR